MIQDNGHYATNSYYRTLPTNQIASGIKSLDPIPGSAETPRFLQLYEYPTELATQIGKNSLPQNRYNCRYTSLPNDNALQLGPECVDSVRSEVIGTTSPDLTEWAGEK